MLDLSGQYLQSYTYELYLRIKPINSSGSNSYNLVDQRGTIIDCGSHSRAIIDSEKIEFVQVGGHYVQYLFSSSENEYSSKFLNYWRHYTFSYQNMSNQIQLNSTVTNLTSQLSFIRIFINGILQASFNFTNPVSNDIFQAKRDLCILGNAQPQNQNIGTALNADLKYLFITQTHRSTNFKEEIFHRYPHQERQAMVLYFKLDESSQFNIDFYNNKAISDLYFKNVQFVSVIEKEQSCECYSAPLNIFNIKRNSTSTQGITLRAADDIKSQGFLIDFFINFQGDLDETTSNVKTLIQADKMIKVMIQSRLLVLQIGDNNINYTSPNSTQYFRRWMHYGIAVYANQSAEVYRNGIRIHSFNFTGSVSNNQTINIKHEITAYFGRFRILKNITNLSVSNLMRETFNNGLINTSFESLISSNVVFDFKLTDVNFANQSLSNSLYSGSYLSNQYRLTFSNVPFVFDNRLCGKQGEWVSVPNYKQNSSDQYNNFYNDYQYGACNDNKYIKQFTSQDNTAGSQAKIMQANIRSVYKEMTIELWFNYQRNKNTQSSVIMSVDQQYNREERFKIELLYFKNRTYDNLGIGSFDQGSGYITHETAIQENQWFHTVWQCSNSQNLAKSYLFEYTNKYSQVKQAQGSISQPNIVLSRTYIGGDNQGQRRFVGSLKDLRIWFQFRTQADINKYRNIMPQDIASAQNLMHYYRFDSDNSYSRIPDFMSYGKNVSYDFTVTLSLNIDSTIRYAQDFNNTSNAPSLTLCEYNTYLTTQFSCALKTDFSISLQNYQNLNSGQFIIDSNIIYLNKDPDSYYSSFELLYTYPNVTNSLVSKQLPLFANQNIRSFNISSFKLNKDYVYIVQYTSYNIMYQEDTLNRQQIAIDPSCPSFSFSNFYKDENTVYLYNSVNKNYSVSIQNNTYCLFEDYYNMSIHNYTWQLVPGQNQTFINSTFNFTLLNNNMTLNITQLQKIPLNQILVFNVSLTYYNLNLNQQQIYYQLVNIKFVQENVIVQYTQNFLRVSWGDQMFIDAQQSFSLIPPFENREVQYEVACPRELFRTTQAYNDLCYIDFKGRIFIEFDQYRSLMLIDSYVHYNFTVTGNVKLENLKSSKIITVQFINITSTSQLCPNIIFEPYYNVSLLDQFTEIFPIYRLECDRSSYISRYDIVNISWSMDLSNVTWIRNQQVASNQDSSNTSADYLNKVITQNLLNVKSEGILSQILHFKSNYTWAQLTDDARYRMKVGESIPVNITYYLTSPELMGQYKMFNLSTSLRRIATDYQMTLVTNKYSLVFDHNETIILDILNTFDPQDPGVILNFLWSCPRPTQNSDIGICKNERSMSDIQITPLHRAIMNWKYNTNYTINATIINPKSQKKQVVGFTVSVSRPPNTTFTQVCPYFDFEQTNQFVIRQDTEDTLMYVSENQTSQINISYPYLKTACGVQNYTFQDLIVDDPNNLIFNNTFNYELGAPNLNRNLCLSINASKIFQNENDKYILYTYLYYSDSTTSKTVYQYNKQIILQKINSSSILVSSFKSTYQRLGVKDLLELDASSSYDTQNIKNRNFNFRWRCPNQLQNQTLCETNTKSLISLTAADRNNLGINFPGQNYKFGMQIYDGVRSSEWLYSSVFIKPDSPNNECLQLGILDQFVTRIVDQYYQYPLLRELMLNQSCQGIQYSQLLTKINPVATMNVSTYLEDQQRQIITESYLGIDRNIIRVPYNLMTDLDRSYYYTYTVAYNIGEEYKDSQTYLETIQFRKYNTPQQLYDQFYIDSPTLLNIDVDQKIEFTIKPTNNSLINYAQLTIQWRCDSKLNLNNICSSFRNQTLTLRNSDRNFTQLLGQVLKIEASVGGTVYSQYFQVVSDNQNQVSTSCQLESNQITYVNTSQLLVIGLNCNNQAFISSNAQYKWSIQSFESLSQLIDGRDDLSIVKIRPGTLLQNRQYFVNLTVIIPNWKYNLTFPYQLSTSQLYVSQVMKTSDIALSQKIGNFYETQFRLQLNANWGTITTTNKLNLFYQVILVLSDGTYHYQQPFQLVPKNYSINLGDLPSFTKMTVEIRNNYGQISNYLVSGYTITLNSKLNISSLLSSKKQIIDNSQDPIVITNQLIQLNQIWGMSSYQPIQSEKYQNFQYAIDKIANTRIYLVNNNAIYCYIDQLCINLFQNLIQLQTKLLLGYDQSLTPAQSKDIIQNYYYFLQDASFINSDYNQDLSENLLKILSRLKSQNPDVVNLYNQEIALINQRIMESQIVKSSPFESSIYSQGDQIIMIGFLKNDEQFKMNNYQSGIQVEIEIDTFQQISREINDYKTASKAFWLPSHKYSRMLGVLSTNNKSDPINNFLAQNQIDINIYDKQGQIYDIQGLRTPIQIYFNYQKSLGSSIWDSQCVYLNTGTGNWTQDETIVTVIDQGNQIIRCQTKHLSKFTVTSRFQKNGMFESAIYRSASLYEISQEKYFIVAVSLLMVFIMVETFGYFVFKNQGLRKIAKLKNRIGLNIIIQTDSSSYGSSSRRSFQDRDFILLSKFRIVKASLYLLNSFMAILNQYPRHIQWVKLQGFITILLAYSIFTSIFFSLRTQIVAFQISNWTELDSFLIALILTILLFYPTVLLQNYLCVLSFESQQKSHRNSMQDIKLEKQNSDVLDSKKDFLKSNDQSLFDLRDQSFIGGYHKTLNCAVNDLEKTDLHIPKDISPIQKQLQRHSFQAGIPSTPKSKRLQQSSIMSPQQDEDLEEVKISKVPQPLNLNQKFQNIKIEDVFQHQSSEAKHHKPKISRFSIAQKIERDHTKLRAHSPEGQSLQSSKGIDVSTIHQDQTNQQEIISMNTPVKLEHIKITVADGPATQEKTKSQEKSSNTLEVVKTIEQQDRIWQVQKIFKQVNTRMCQITAINGLVLIFTLLMFALTSPSNLIAFLISLVIIAALNMLINLSLGTYLSRYVIQDKNKELQIELPQGKLNRIISKYLIGDKTLIQIQQKLMRCFYENQNKNQSSQQS